MFIYGLNPVIEALRAGRVRRLKVGPRGDKRVDEAITLAQRSGVAIDRVEAPVLDRHARGGVHQGLVAELEAAPEYSVPELVELAAPDPPLLVVLDGIEDPQNLGAIARSVAGAGAHGIIRQARRSASLDGAAVKASAGALATVRIATVVNIARAIEELSDAHVWTVGLAGDASDLYDAVDLALPTAIVVGSEGEGLRRLTRERCDRLVRIPLAGSVESLNVSVATGIALFEAVRQRRSKSR